MTSPGEAKRYNRQKILLDVLSTVLGIGFLVFVLVSGVSTMLSGMVTRWTVHAVPAFVFYVLILGGAGFVIELPLHFYSGYVLEHRYDLSKQSVGSWCLESLKGLGVSLMIGLPLLIVFYVLLRGFPVFWWIPVGVVYFVFSVVLAQLAPVLIFPVFYRFTPVDDVELTRRLKSMSEAEGLIVSDVFRFDMSKNTKKANAAFTGLGKTRRIILADTLLDGFPPKEVEAVLAHELGHYRFGHLWKGLMIGAVISFGGLFAAAMGYRSTLGAFGGLRGDELSVLPLLALYMAAFGLLAAPVRNAVSRRFERQADAYVVKTMNEPEAFVSALKRLGQLNKADETPHPFVEFYFYSHPALGRRIQKIRQLAGVDA